MYERVGDTLWKIKIKALEDTNLPGGRGVRLYLTPKEGNQLPEPMKVSLLLSKGSPSLLLKYSKLSKKYLLAECYNKKQKILSMKRQKKMARQEPP